MTPSKLSILIVDDEPAVSEIIAESLHELKAQTTICVTAEAAELELKKRRFDCVFCDVHLPGRSGLSMFESMRDSDTPLPPFVFITGNVDPAIAERASRIGAAELLLKPFDRVEIRRAFDRARASSQDALADIMNMVQAISGIVLGPDKRMLVETRLNRRARQLGLPDVRAYLGHFRAHREAEVHHLISLISTHTTEFFREPLHFDHLVDILLPDLFARGKPIAMWSAAASTGEEAYSMAIATLDTAKTLPSAITLPLSILGTDIDFGSIERARNGVYPRESLRGLPRDIADRHFQLGSGELAGLARVRDDVHALCDFRQMNLLDFSAYPAGPFDVIFLRNVLIYFAPADVKRIAAAMHDRLSPEGKLFLGHSESLSNLSTSLELVGSAIYRRKGTSIRLREKSQRPIRAIIVDDSATIRQLMRRILSTGLEIEVVGEAEDTFKAEKLLETTQADVMTLDIHMPLRDGITWLESLQNKPRPAVVMVSSVSAEDAAGAMRCFELGAFDYVEKPAAGSLELVADRLREVVIAAAHNGKPEVQTRLKASARRSNLRPLSAPSQAFDRRSLLLLGASTGGVEALTSVLESFSPDGPPVIVVQHIPPRFSRTFAERLDRRCALSVKEAEDGDRVQWGHVYIAPGGRHLQIVQGPDGSLRLSLLDTPPVNRHRPSVDTLFASVAKLAHGRPISAALLTGMGDDGARGLLALRAAGAYTLAQDEETSVVYGMPKVAKELGAAVEVVPLPSIGYHMLRGLTKKLAA